VGVFVKVCGLSRAEDVEGVAALGPDALGFIFYPPSPRCVTPEAVSAWTRDLPAGIRKVGVFVDADPDELRRVRDVAGLDVLQLHGCETPARCAGLPGSVWKAVHLDRPGGALTEGYRVDAFLVDGYSSRSPGGTGVQTDWARAADFAAACTVPVLLAGGLRPDNVEEALRRVRPWGVDVSSGVEVAPGVKSLEHVKAFIETCRS